MLHTENIYKTVTVVCEENFTTKKLLFFLPIEQNSKFHLFNVVIYSIVSIYSSIAIIV